jgi:hypothetical protein
MTKTTRAQREAFKRVFARTPLYPSYNGGFTSNPTGPSSKPVTYCQFRRSIFVTESCAMVQWCGMWLGIEADGYTHS